jgi:hypothetical protein
MADFRLRIKIGENEFEAEGPIEIVQEQFDYFRELVGTPTSKIEKQSLRAPSEDGEQSGNGAELSLDKIMRVDGRVVSLIDPPNSAADAFLLILLGHRQFRGKLSVGGTEMAESLRASHHPMVRAERVADRLASEGFVTTNGTHRSRRYELTNAGVARGRKLLEL